MVHETENAVGANADAVREDFSMVEFREQCRRQLGRRLEDRIKYGFCRVYKPVLDDAPWRTFATTAEYREWCDASLPEYLGFRIATP
jgi:hypothetical protein